MSVNYSAPHRVDIPVTDLDDSEDDVLFNQQMGGHVGHHHEVDDLDFDQHPTKSWWHTLTGVFKLGGYNKVESYELGNANDFINHRDFIVTSEDDEGNDGPDSFIHDDIGLKLPRQYLFPIKTFGLYMIIGILSILVIVGFTIKSNPHVTALTVKPILSNATHNFYPTTIVVSLDGFHPHYISPKLTPALHDMMMNDYGAPYMTPSFPSSTFPNHWTLITGLYPTEHGIVGNTFYDPQLSKQFVNTNPQKGGLDPDFWQGGEPIWKTAYLQQVKSAVHMWPGSEVPGIGIDGGPLEVDRYNGSELLSSKVKRVMGWLDVDDIDQRPELILTYVPTVDLYGHKYGISGPELSGALTYVDDFISLLRKEIDSRNLNDIVNLIIVSDHGMAPTSNERLLYLDDIIDVKKIEHIDGWPLFGLRPYNDYSVDDIFNELKSNLHKLDGLIKDYFKLYKVEDIPKQWQFGGKVADHKFNYRLAPIWIIPNVGYSVTTHEQMKENNNVYSPKGVHGYNNTELLMRALFLGTGPYFKSILSENNRRVNPFPNTEVYNIICNTLNIVPSPNNGTLENGHLSPIINVANTLPADWTDNLTYPNLEYQVEHIVDDATYDLLWRPRKPEDGLKTVYTSSNTDPAKSIDSEESTFSKFDPSLPKPSDFETTRAKATETHIAQSSMTTDKTVPSGKSGLLDDLWDDLEHLGNDIGEGIGDIGDHIDDSLDEVGEAVQDIIDNLFDNDNDRRL